MTAIVDLGCQVANLHHRYAAVHDSLFGASSAIKGTERRTYADYGQGLAQLGQELARLGPQIAGQTSAPGGHRVEPLRDALLDYTQSLSRVVTALQAMCGRLAEDAAGYRKSPPQGQSAFNRDKVEYDYALREMERLGTRLNKLFASF